MSQVNGSEIEQKINEFKAAFEASTKPVFVGFGQVTWYHHLANELEADHQRKNAHEAPYIRLNIGALRRKKFSQTLFLVLMNLATHLEAQVKADDRGKLLDALQSLAERWNWDDEDDRFTQGAAGIISDKCHAIIRDLSQNYSRIIVCLEGYEAFLNDWSAQLFNYVVDKLASEKITFLLLSNREKKPKLYLNSSELSIEETVEFHQLFEIESQLILIASRKNLVNPYKIDRPWLTDAGPFVGRKEVLKKLQDKINEKVNGNMVYVWGEKGVGKTSLLNKLRADNAMSAKVAKLDFVSIFPGNPSKLIVEDLITALCLILELAKDGGRPKDDDEFLEFLNKYPIAQHQPAVILVDNAHTLDNRGVKSGKGKNLLNQISNILRAVSRHCCLIFFGSTAPQNSTLKWLLLNCCVVPLQPFSKEETKELFDDPMSAIVSLETGVSEKVFELTEGRPHFVQRLGHECVEYLRRNFNKESFSPAEIEEIGRRVLGKNFYGATEGAVERQAGKLFVNYIQADFEKVNVVYHRLVKEGYTPWMDKFDIKGGERWEEAIMLALKTAKVFLAFLSRKSTSTKKRKIYKNEIREALHIENKNSKDRFIIPVRLEVCKVPENLAHFQYVDLFRKGGFENLLRSIKDAIKSQEQAILDANNQEN